MSPSPSDVKNPNSPAYKANNDNRSRQIQANKEGRTQESSRSAPTPNDQRSNVNNPNSAAYKANQDNRSRQIAENKSKGQ